MTRKLVIAPIHFMYSDHRTPLPKIIRLDGGYEIRRFNSRLLNSALDFFREFFSEREKQDIQNCRYAIYHRYETIEDSSEITEEIITSINRIILTLRIVRQTRALASIFNFKLEGNRKIPLQASQMPVLNITFPGGVSVGSQHFVRNDAAKIRKYFRAVQGLYNNFGGTYHKVLNALFFFEIGHYNHLYKPRLVLFVTCLESLFNTSKEQVGYTLKLRCSYFLERRPQSRLTLGDLLKDIYDLRSAFVHGQGSPNNILNNVPRQEHLLLEAESISRRCLQKIFDKNIVHVFNTPNGINREFKNLEFGLPTTLR